MVEAIACAVEVQRAMIERNTDVPQEHRIEFRVGIHQGDIIVEDSDIFGDGVNLAARLEGLAEPGAICLSRVVRDEVRDKLEIGFHDLGEQQFKNIARPMQAFAVLLSHEIIEGAGHGAALPLPDKPSIAVLPFQNMTGDSEQDYFVDGIVEEITTAIPRLPRLFVIAGNSAFAYRARPSI